MYAECDMKDENEGGEEEKIGGNRFTKADRSRFDSNLIKRLSPIDFEIEKKRMKAFESITSEYEDDDEMMRKQKTNWKMKKEKEKKWREEKRREKEVKHARNDVSKRKEKEEDERWKNNGRWR